MATQPLHKRLMEKYIRCSLNNQQFLPLDVIDKEITEENVKAEMKRKKFNLLNSQVPKNVVQNAKKVFTILVIIGEPNAIKDLLSEEITDDHLPLSRRGGSIGDDVLVSSDGKEFPAFAAWDNDIRVADFLEKQWIVQAPVLDSSGGEVSLDRQCALPFLTVEEVGNGEFSTVYRSDIHPAHQKGLQVSSMATLALTTKLRLLGGRRCGSSGSKRVQEGGTLP